MFTPKYFSQDREYSSVHKQLLWGGPLSNNFSYLTPFYGTLLGPKMQILHFCREGLHVGDQGAKSVRCAEV